MCVLSDSFLNSLVARLDNENTIGVVLLGSFARAEGGRFSDVDIRCYVRMDTPISAGDGLEPLPQGEPAFIGYGKPDLRLYCETAGLLQDILLPKGAEVINRTLEIIAEAGY